MVSLRFPWLWLILGWTMVVAICVGSLMPADDMPQFRTDDKLLHAGSYFLLMIWFGGLYERRRHAVVAVVLGGLGLLLDILQGSTSTRSFEPMDIFANMGGIAVGLGLTLWILAGWCQRMERRLFA